jgi:hypothetical protein
MSFELKDLVNATRCYKNKFILLEEFNLDSPYHALIHHKKNRIITLAKYKKTIDLLSDSYEFQPHYNLQNNSISAVLESNTYMTYDVVLTGFNPPVRWASEHRFNFSSAVRTSSNDTWDLESLTKETISALRLKAATLDKIYEMTNSMRSSLVSDIVLDEYIYNNRYKQALDFINNKTDNISLLKIYANQFETDLLNAAKYCIFCYDEDQIKIAKSEENLSNAERNILNSTSLETLQEIVLPWLAIYSHYL